MAASEHDRSGPGDNDAEALQRRLLAAHDVGDRLELSRLYAAAGDMADEAGDRDRAAFFLTHAWIFALEAGSATAERLHARLRDWGRC